jgi:AcrR family transcriptional regulator
MVIQIWNEDKIMEKVARKEREFKMRRTEILEQAEKVFAAKGFHNVTMAEIAAASGFSIGSLYQFFAGKENLYTTMLSEKLDLMYGQIREEVKSSPDIEGKIRALIAAHFRFVENNADFCRLFMRGESAALSEVMTSVREKIINDYSQHLLFIENVLKSGIKDKYLRQLQPHDMAGALFGLIRSQAVDWMILPGNVALNSKTDFILDIFLEGVKK